MFDIFNHFVSGYSELAARRRTERIMSELSPELRKDIGWRGTHPSDRAFPDRRLHR